MIESSATDALSVVKSRVSTGLAKPTHSVWHVFTEVGTQVMTLAALEAALQRGDVSLSTLVWISGMAEWEPLGEVANLQSAALVAPGSLRASGIQLVAHRAGEPEHPVCNCARSTGLAPARAARKAALATAAKGAQARRKSGLLDRCGQRRWRRAATLLAALVLMLLGGRRLAEAVAHQQQHFTAPAPTEPPRG